MRVTGAEKKLRFCFFLILMIYSPIQSVVLDWETHLEKKMKRVFRKRKKNVRLGRKKSYKLHELKNQNVGKFAQHKPLR